MKTITKERRLDDWFIEKYNTIFVATAIDKMASEFVDFIGDYTHSLWLWLSGTPKEAFRSFAYTGISDAFDAFGCPFIEPKEEYEIITGHKPLKLFSDEQITDILLDMIWEFISPTVLKKILEGYKNV